MKSVYLFLITGFEEIEAVATIDTLRRAGINVKTVSLTSDKTVIGGHDIPVTADIRFGETDYSDAEMLVVPGGTVAFNDHAGLKNLIESFYSQGRRIAAICASPIIFGTSGILKGKKATCYPGFEKYLEGATLRTDLAVVTDGVVTTGRGPGLTIEFALELVEILTGKEKRDEVAGQLLVK